MATVALCPGTFDPVTNGHIDIIERASRCFERVLVAVLANPRKGPLFTVDERVAMLKEAVSGIEGVEIDSFSGLLVDYAKARGVRVIVKGLRAVTDFDYELQMAQMNSTLLPELDTMFVATKPEWSFLSSSLVKEVARYGGTIDGLVPSAVATAVSERYGR